MRKSRLDFRFFLPFTFVSLRLPSHLPLACSRVDLLSSPSFFRCSFPISLLSRLLSMYRLSHPSIHPSIPRFSLSLSSLHLSRYVTPSSFSISHHFSSSSRLVSLVGTLPFLPSRSPMPNRPPSSFFHSRFLPFLTLVLHISNPPRFEICLLATYPCVLSLAMICFLVRSFLEEGKRAKAPTRLQTSLALAATSVSPSVLPSVEYLIRTRLHLPETSISLKPGSFWLVLLSRLYFLFRPSALTLGSPHETLDKSTDHRYSTC